MDLAGKAYWETQWRIHGSGRLRLLSCFRHSFGHLLSQHLSPGSSACEIGCGASTWLPFLARRGVDVWGIDYSPTGIALARRNLAHAGVTATLVEADLFEGRPLPPAHFHLIISLGFLEHFDDAGPVVARMAEFLRPDGVMITLVPNLAGLWGTVQRRLDFDVYAAHVPHTPETLDHVHAVGGLEALTPARYFGGFGPLTVNYGRLLQRLPRPVGRAGIAGVWGLQQAISWIMRLSPISLDSKLLSPHVLGLYHRSPVSATAGRDR